MNSNTFVADYVDSVHFAYTCTYCWTHVNKDGRPRKNARNIQHRHGSCGNLENRIEGRMSHCKLGEVNIIINDTTKKIIS